MFKLGPVVRSIGYTCALLTAGAIGGSVATVKYNEHPTLNDIDRYNGTDLARFSTTAPYKSLTQSQAKKWLYEKMLVLQGHDKYISSIVEEPVRQVVEVLRAANTPSLTQTAQNIENELNTQIEKNGRVKKSDFKARSKNPHALEYTIRFFDGLRETAINKLIDKFTVTEFQKIGNNEYKFVFKYDLPWYVMNNAIHGVYGIKYADYPESVLKPFSIPEGPNIYAFDVEFSPGTTKALAMKVFSDMNLTVLDIHENIYKSVFSVVIQSPIPINDLKEHISKQGKGIIIAEEKKI